MLETKLPQFNFLILCLSSQLCHELLQSLTAYRLRYKATEQLWFHCRRRQTNFLFSTSFRSSLRSMQTLLQSVMWAPSLRVKRWEREADNSFPSTAKVKNTCCYTSPITFCLIKHKENFTSIFIFAGRIYAQIPKFHLIT